MIMETGMENNKENLWKELLQARNDMFGDMYDMNLYTICYGINNGFYNNQNSFNELYVLEGELFPDLDTALKGKIYYGYNDEGHASFFSDFNNNTIEFCNYVAFIIECHERGVCKYGGILNKDSFIRSSEPKSLLYFATEEELEMFYDIFYDRLLEYSKLC